MRSLLYSPAHVLSKRSSPPFTVSQKHKAPGNHRVVTSELIASIALTSIAL